MGSQRCQKEFPANHHEQSGGCLSALKMEGRRVAGLRLLCKRVMWRAVNKRTSLGGEATEKCWAWWEFRRAFTAWGTKMVKGGSHNDFLSGLNQKGSGHNGSKATGVSPRLRVQFLAIILNGSPRVLGWEPQGHSLPFHIQKRKKRNLIIGMPKGRWVHQTLL